MSLFEQDSIENINSDSTNTSELKETLPSKTSDNILIVSTTSLAKQKKLKNQSSTTLSTMPTSNSELSGLSVSESLKLVQNSFTSIKISTRAVGSFSLDEVETIVNYRNTNKCSNDALASALGLTKKDFCSLLKIHEFKYVLNKNSYVPYKELNLTGNTPQRNKLKVGKRAYNTILPRLKLNQEAYKVLLLTILETKQSIATILNSLLLTKTNESILKLASSLDITEIKYTFSRIKRKKSL
jgi:hypothetical protein